MVVRNFFNKAFRKVCTLSRLVLRTFINFVPRDNKLIVYGGALDLFIDNAKYLFIYNSNNLKDYKNVWITSKHDVYKRLSSLGFVVYKRKSLKGIFALLRAKFICFDYEIQEFADYDLTQGAIQIQMWHGLSIKMVGFANSDNLKPYVQTKGDFYEWVYKEHHLGTHLLSVSEWYANIHLAAFEIPSDRVIKGTYPRTEILKWNEENREAFINSYETPSFNDTYKKIKEDMHIKIIYMPTFRDNNPNYITTAIPDWVDFNNMLNEYNIVIYLKLHRMTPMPSDLNLTNIKIIDNDMDIYPLMPLFDCMISDYSSAMLDYSIIKKPVILYPFDIEEYVENHRKLFSFYYDILRFLPVANTFNELKELLMDKESFKKTIPIERYIDQTYPQGTLAIDNFIRKNS